MRLESTQNQRPGRSERRGPVTALATLMITVIGGAFFGGCSSGPGGVQNGASIDVKYYHMNPLNKIETLDPMIAFERQHYMHGAVSGEDQEARYGNYFTILWKVDDQTGPVKLRFEYRHGKTGTTTEVMEADVADVKRKNRTVFKVVGDQYFEKGKIVSFKVSLLRGEEVLATSESFLWKD